MKISFQSALITGGSRGLGRAIAVKLAQEGVSKIAIHYYTRKDEAEKTIALIRDAGADGVLVQGDTSDAKRAEEIAAEAAAKLGGCDIFVQSVVPTPDRIYEHTPGGMTGGWQPWVGMGSAKAAVESMCRYFAVALARDGITVNAVSPGASDETPLIGQTPKEVQDLLKEWAGSGWTPMRRRVAPQDVANVCALLCSEEASFVTGQTIAVDGGSSLMNPDFPLALQVPK